MKACSIFTKLFDDEDEKIDDRNEIFSSAGALTQSVGKSTSKALHAKKSIFAKNFDIQALIDALTIETPVNTINASQLPFTSFREAVLEYFLNIAINHNVLAEISTEDQSINYQGSNPDEVTLVTSAAEIGIEFLGRSQKTVRIKVMGEIVEFEIIQKFDFTSARMRSSVIIRDPQGNLKLYMKGADTAVLRKLDEYSMNNLLKTNKDHLEDFAKRGLRTLCYSYRILDQKEYNNWEIEYNEMRYRAINDKSLQPAVEDIISKIESDQLLLGITGLEDKLQDNVTNDLQEFLEAGINFWMITGDKMDTAESIGHSCSTLR